MNSNFKASSKQIRLNITKLQEKSTNDFLKEVMKYLKKEKFVENNWDS